jgi:ADP-ribose pyrophosphatase YjhB (NUDIX family)
MEKINILDEENEIKEINRIFKTLMHFPGSTFSDLWDKEIPSNKFTYHLKKMETEKLIEKRDGKYYLTVAGKSFATTVDGETGTTRKRPLVGLLLIVKKDDKYILYHRQKEPYYGNCGFPGAKVEYGEEILDAAKRELFEETGLSCDGEIITIQNAVITNDKKLFGHITQYFVLFENPTGELIKENREGTYEWATKEKIISQKNLFPDIPGAIEIVEENKFVVRETKIIQKNEKFKDIKFNVLFERKRN